MIGRLLSPAWLATVVALGLAAALATSVEHHSATLRPDPHPSGPRPLRAPASILTITPKLRPGTVAQSGSRSFTMLMTGDVLLHEGFWSTARRDAGGEGLDFRPVLAPMRPTISAADLAICHLETPLAARAGPYRGYPLFSAPPQIAPALAWAGYDACTTASNHSVDQGLAGIRRTVDDLDRAGIAHAGSYADESTAGSPMWLDAGSARVAVISATFGLNGLPLPPGAPWAVNLIRTTRIIRQARAARAEGADVVVVALHWGEEYQHQPTTYQRDIARRLAGSGAVDLIYGHHAHVVQPYGRIRGVWVIYGLGNAIAQQDPAYADRWEGNAARVTFAEDGDGHWAVSRVESIPTFITPYGRRDSLRYLDVGRALRQPHWADLRARLRLAREHVRADVDALGFRPGPSAP